MVNEAEFGDSWLSRDLGGDVSAGYLFSRADTDRDGIITEFPDMQWVCHYLDLNGPSHCPAGPASSGGWPSPI